jgi:hypothetical protein
MIGDGGAHQSHPMRVFGDARQHALDRRQPHAAVGRPPHHAVGAAAMTPALGLDEEHVAQLGVWRADLGVRGQAQIVGGGDGRHGLAVNGGHVEPGPGAELAQQGGAIAVASVAERAHQCCD